MSLSPQFLDELRSRTLLSGLVGRSLKIQKAGREFRACCPFHNEKSPSFYVNDEKGFYHCFGCGAHGDAIRWMTDQQGLPFMDAVKELAANAGMDVPAPDPRAQERQERGKGLLDAMEAAADFFEQQLGGLDGSEARTYLERRGINDTQRRTFRIGFAPDSRSKLKTALKEFGPEKLIESGLLISVDDKEPYDRFRGRLMIPIRDARGRVIAFGGRILGDGEPKYLNSPDTPLFDKGRTLFNLDRASAASRKANRLIVVEGYMDVIALDRAGIGEAVAPLGTALTEAQLERLWRMADLPILCFDGDAAGQKAAIRAAQRALPMIGPGRSLRFVTLPAGQDPDDLVRSGGKSAIEALLDAPQPLVDRLWEHELAAIPLDTPEARAGLRQRLGEHVSAIGDPHVRDQYAREFRNRFDQLFARPAERPARPRFSRPDDRRPKDRRWPVPPQPPSDSARAIGGGGVEPIIMKAIIAGLIRYPDIIAANAEVLGALQIRDRKLDTLRSALIAAAFEAPALERERVRAILANAGLGVDLERNLSTNGLAFSFLRGNADSERAKHDLVAVISALASRPELDAALAAVTERLMVSPDEAVFAEQRRLRAAREEADRALAALVEGTEV
jgi:DNA primase